MNKISIEDVKNATILYTKKQEDELAKNRKEEKEAKNRADGIFKFFEEVENMEGVGEVKKLLKESSRKIYLFNEHQLYEVTCSFSYDGFEHRVDYGGGAPDPNQTNSEMASLLGIKGYTREQLSQTFFSKLNDIISQAST